MGDFGPKELGLRVRELRRTRGWTQTELAERIGVQQSAVAKIERGAVDPTTTMIVKLAKALGVSPGHLLRMPKE
jgi:transcriptional regulator with XRE-family HTH domain